MHRSLIFLIIVFLFTPSLAQPARPGLTIPEIQGSGAASPYAEQKLARPLRGCVTGVAAEGFFLQDQQGDGDARTSDGIYVYRYSSWKNPRGLKPGDLVELSTYQVTEFYGQTELNGLPNDKNATYRVLGRCPLPAPVLITPLVDPGADPAVQYESKEGMRVTVDLDASVAGPTARFESRYPAGDPELTVVPAGNPYYGSRIFARELPVDRGSFSLSGALGVDLPAVNLFDRVTGSGLSGILAYQFGRYVLLVENPGAIEVQPAPVSLPSAQPVGPDGWTVCTFNAKNLFDALDDGDGDMGDWTPANDAAYRTGIERRTALLHDRLGACTVLAVQEIEGKDAVWADLAAGFGPDYRFDYRESEDVRDITVGLIYDGTRVEVRGSSSVQACSAVDYGVNYASATGTRADENPCPGGTYPLYDRPPYVADIVVANADLSRRVEVRLVVVHLKSKRGDEAENAERRVQQARHVAALLAREQGAGPESIALGDFNDDLGSEPLAEFAAYFNLYERHVPPADRYSYIYNGRAEAIDHVIMTPQMDTYFLGGGPVHVNADYAEPLQGASGRISDHDPLVASFSFHPTGISAGLTGASAGAVGYHHRMRLKK